LLSATCNHNKEAAAPEQDQANLTGLYNKYDLHKIKLPPGFKIHVFAEVPNARSLCLGDNGTVFVGNRKGDKVYAVTDKDRNGFGDQVFTIASGLRSPNGVAFRKGSLYVAEISRIIRFDDIENRLSSPPSYQVVHDQFPTDGSHGWKFIAFGPDDKLYVPVGAPCNICKSDSIYASITRMNPDGSGREIFAHGIRNTIGFTWHPETRELWFTENGRDNMGDNVPADELNIAPRKGMHFGYPFCHQGDTPDPKFGGEQPCSAFEKPALNLGPHVAALGIRFYTGDMFPGNYRNQAFIAEHGSWNRTTPIGYRVMSVRLQNGKPVQYEPFATGWLQPDGQVIGRPVDVLVMPDGAMLVSDDKSGVIYRISYQK
ncbi:MAG TPA: sorbosone dehydrogenase family protein, partial [Flavisolibacter sp.]